MKEFKISFKQNTFIFFSELLVKNKIICPCTKCNQYPKISYESYYVDSKFTNCLICYIECPICKKRVSCLAQKEIVKSDEFYMYFGNELISAWNSYYFNEVFDFEISEEDKMPIMDLIMQHEGLKLKPYKDTVGKLTIGYGRNLDDVGISDAEAYLLLNNDVQACVKKLNAEFFWFQRLGEVRQAVLIDMCFNLGINGLLKFKNTLSLIEGARYAEAAEEMLKSVWADQVKDRAVRLSEMMKTGQWPE